MGQYYRGAILDLNSFKKNEINVVKAFCCYSHCNGAKLMEHSYVGNWYVKEYEKALATEFFGMPFVWVGDYADVKFDTEVYLSADSYINEKTKEKTEYDTLPTYNYIVNLDKKLFVRIPENNKDKNKLIIHPLPLLCCSGNKRGGGDYYGTNEQLVGSWAYDRIGVTNELPKDITEELIVTFEEKY